MTKLWKPTELWQGQTVAVLASGPGMNARVAESLRQHRCIAVNHTSRLAPWADMLVSLDGAWSAEFREFAGMRVTGVEDDDLDALYAGPMYEQIELSPGHRIDVRNSGLAAVRIAAAMGASRVILAGFDPEARRRWHDDEVDTGAYVGIATGLQAIVTELVAAGLQVERVAPETAEADDA